MNRSPERLQTRIWPFLKYKVKRDSSVKSTLDHCCLNLNTRWRRTYIDNASCTMSHVEWGSYYSPPWTKIHLLQTMANSLITDQGIYSYGCSSQLPLSLFTLAIRIRKTNRITYNITVLILPWSSFVGDLSSFLHAHFHCCWTGLSVTVWQNRPLAVANQIPALLSSWFQASQAPFIAQRYIIGVFGALYKNLKKRSFIHVDTFVCQSGWHVLTNGTVCTCISTDNLHRRSASARDVWKVKENFAPLFLAKWSTLHKPFLNRFKNILLKHFITLFVTYLTKKCIFFFEPCQNYSGPWILLSNIFIFSKHLI